MSLNLDNLEQDSDEQPLSAKAKPYERYKGNSKEANPLNVRGVFFYALLIAIYMHIM